MDSLEPGRKFLKSDRWGEWRESETDQKQKAPPPPLQQPYPQTAPLIDLPAPNVATLGQMPLGEAMRRRRSRRKFTAEPLTLAELSFLLWATQGVSEIIREGIATYRTVPSGGARHPFETYLFASRITSLEQGLYRYLALEHKLYWLRTDPEMARQVSEACNSQSFVSSGAVTFLWTAIPYRTEWRYSIVAHKIIALDAGHVCQNLYLACEALGAGTCAVGSYDQSKLDTFLGVDGQDEFAIYVAPVGKVTPAAA
jgi:SagB-type dehydrogenase family enzyme